jgi:FHS family L-fucose permease-like MFS transporter
MYTASKLILAKLSTSQFRADQMSAHPEYESLPANEINARITEAYETFKAADPATFTANQIADIAIIRNPYAILGSVIALMFILFLFKKMPDTGTRGTHMKASESAKRLFKNAYWREGVIAQTFYVAAQITCWTFIIQYAMENVAGMTLSKAQNYNITAMGLFLVSRFICTFLLKYLSPGKLLMQLSTLAAILMLCTIFLQNYAGLLCLVGISGCMSLMFPTIYGIALKGTGDDAKIGSAGLVFAIVGGALMPLAMGFIMDGDGIGNLNAVSLSFFMPFISFVIIAIFGYRANTLLINR